MAGRKQMAFGFCPPLYASTKGGDIMTTYEILVIVLMIITLAFGIHNSDHK